MKWKKIYIEITNQCNLSCSFCSISKREKKSLGKQEFTHIIKEIRPFTDYIYLHVKGEPLLHPELDSFLEVCDQEQLKVNITTNGTLLKSCLPILKRHECIRQVNLSLHSENRKEHYLEEVFAASRELAPKVVVIYRFWTLKENQLDQKTTDIVEKMSSYYNLSTEIVENIRTKKNTKIAENIYVDKANLFAWPTMEEEEETQGYCLGGKDQLAILSDGTVVPCCLDGEGEIAFGNIFQTSFLEIMESPRFQNLQKGFQMRKPSEELCRKCSFKNRFDLENNFSK